MPRSAPMMPALVLFLLLAGTQAWANPAVGLSEDEIKSSLQLSKEGKLSEAEAMARRALGNSISILEKNSLPKRARLMAMSHFALGQSLRLQGRLPEAESELRTATTDLAQYYGKSNSKTLKAMMQLSLCLISEGHAGEAEGVLRDLLARLADNPDAKEGLREHAEAKLKEIQK